MRVVVASSAGAAACAVAVVAVAAGLVCPFFSVPVVGLGTLIATRVNVYCLRGMGGEMYGQVGGV